MTQATRRGLLAGAAALALLAGHEEAQAFLLRGGGSSAGGAPPPSGLTINIVGSSVPSMTFSQGAATSVGDYVGSFVTQHCFRQRQGNWTVFFRPDASPSTRQEIVVEYGVEYNWVTGATPTPIGGGSPAHITTSYTATISGPGIATPIVITVPNHWWGARWRWQSAPRAVVRTAADLVTAKATLPFTAAAVWNTSIPGGVAWTGPMGIGDLATGLAGTGDRPELGYVTEQQAAYLITGNSGALTTLLTDAEAAGTFAYHVRDAGTGAPFSVQTFPYYGFANGARSYNLIPAAGVPSASNFFVLSEATAHMPALGFVPWMLTDDPYFLEECQFCANYCMIESNFFNFLWQIPGAIGSLNGSRAFAWGMRELFRMAGFAPASPPSWLAPKSYFAACVADNLTLTNRYINASASPCTTIFHQIPLTSYMQGYMLAYLVTVMGWAAWSGLFTSWAAAIPWIINPLIQLTASPGGAGGSAWDARWPLPYLVSIADARLGATSGQAGNADYTIAGNANTPTTWAELWADFQLAVAAPANVVYDPAFTNPSGWAANTLAPRWQNGGYLQYADYTLAALSAAQQGGISGAAAARAWLYGQCNTFFQQSAISGPPGTPSGYKWGISPT